MACEGCNSNKAESPREVPYIVYESSMGRAERIIKRLIIALIVAVILIFASNGVWLWYISGYDFSDYDYTQDGQGINIIGEDNEVTQSEPTFENPQTD